MGRFDRPASADDYRERARRRLPRLLFDYIDGGSYSEQALARNLDAMGRVLLRQRVLQDMSRLNCATTLFGQSLSMPLLLGPVGLSGMYARRGEVQAARAARDAGLPFCLSTVSICSLAETQTGSGNPPWFQVYMIRDRAFMADLIAQASQQHCPVLILTVDMPVPGARHRDTRSGMHGGLSPIGEALKILRTGSHLRWMWDVWLRGRPHVFGNVAPVMPDARTLPEFWQWLRDSFDPSITWDDIAWLRARWNGPIVVKGIMDPDDAREAVRHGVDGIIVSNHGGRQLDNAAASIEALPSVVEAVDNAVPVLFDGGVRTGLDMLKALALGARACLIGRPWAYALGADGERGVSMMIEMFRRELMTAMTLTGCADIATAGPHLVDRRFPA